MSTPAEKVAPSTSPATASVVTAAATTVANASAPTASKEIIPGDLKERLAFVVNQAIAANNDGRLTIGNLGIARNFGHRTVTSCDEAVFLLNEILKSLDPNSFAFKELTPVQEGAKTCDTQAKAAVQIIEAVSTAALVALQKGDEALADLIAVYNSLPGVEAKVTTTPAQFPLETQRIAIDARKSSETKDSISTQVKSITDKLAVVISAATQSNLDGKMAVANLNSVQALGTYSVVACDAAVELLDDILKTLDKSSKVYKELNAVQTKAKACQKDSHEAIVVINDLVTKASAALAIGDGSLRALSAVNGVLKTDVERKPHVAVVFSSTAAAAANASVAPGSSSPSSVAAVPPATAAASNNCRIT